MIDYTKYKKFYTGGGEYNIAILDQDVSCVEDLTDIVEPPSISVDFISELVYTPTGYLQIFVNGYYCQWLAAPNNHGITILTYDFNSGNVRGSIGGVAIEWPAVYIPSTDLIDYTYNPADGTLSKSYNGVMVKWSVTLFAPTIEERDDLTGGTVIDSGTPNERYKTLDKEGSNFTGLVEVNNGIARTFYTQQLLEPKRLFSTDTALSVYTYDRLVGDDITLPYSLNELLFDANDYLTFNLIKDRFTKLHINNTYVYSRMFIPNNNLPASNNVRYLGISPETVNTVSFKSSATNLTLYDKVQQTIRLDKTDNFEELGNIKKFVSTKYAENIDTFVIFGISDTKFISLSTDLVTTQFIEVADKYETIENQLPFGKLDSICLNDTSIFITDFESNNILKYEVEGFFSNDRAFSNKRNFIEVLGGTGLSTDPSRFNGPTKICCTNQHIAVYDSGNSTCKVFDTQFNFIKRLSGPPFRREPLAAMEFDVLENRLYILTYYKDTGMKLYVYDSEFNLKEQHILDETLNHTSEEREVVINLAFAKANNNYWYICTNFNVFQKLKNRPSKILGRYQSDRLKFISGATTAEVTYIWNLTDIDFDKLDVWWNFYDTTSEQANSLIASNRFRGISMINNFDNQDDVILLTDSRLYSFKEPYLFKKVTKKDTYPNYGAAKLTINRDEYVQTATINKEIYKVLNDIYTLKNNLVGRFTGNYDAVGVFTLQDYNYNVDISQFNESDISEYYIHDNEKAILGVINRSIKSIYELQSKLIELSDIDYGEKLIPIYNLEGGTLILE